MLETTRLVLVPLTHEQLHLYKNQRQALASDLGIKSIAPHDDPETLPDLEEAIEFWIESTEKHPQHFAWYTNWLIILKQESVAIGGIGFSGSPKEGKSMVGYGLNSQYFGKNYATEALKAMVDWAFKNPDLDIITADTPLEHWASQRVLEKNGFKEFGRDEALIHWELHYTD
ncbi:MAG: N-acetyltransferase [Cytophagia bacterium]|nr:N-acetyltransferase [Cytophagia bacterium]